MVPPNYLDEHSHGGPDAPSTLMGENLPHDLSESRRTPVILAFPVILAYLGAWVHIYRALTRAFLVGALERRDPRDWLGFVQAADR